MYVPIHPLTNLYISLLNLFTQNTQSLLSFLVPRHPLYLPRSVSKQRNQVSEGPCFIWWQRLINAWQTARPWDVLHEWSTNTPPLCRYAFAHASIIAMWEVCVPESVCHAGPSKKKPRKFPSRWRHGTMEVAKLRLRPGPGWWGRRTWDDMVWFSCLEQIKLLRMGPWIHTKESTDEISHQHTKKTPFPVFCLPLPTETNVWANKRMKAKGEAWPELWMSQSVIAASLLVMQTESHSDCPTSQAKGWKTFTCKYEWPTSYCEHASYGILNAQQPQKTPAQKTCQSTALL